MDDSNGRGKVGRDDDVVERKESPLLDTAEEGQKSDLEESAVSMSVNGQKGDRSATNEDAALRRRRTNPAGGGASSSSRTCTAETGLMITTLPQQDQGGSTSPKVGSAVQVTGDHHDDDDDEDDYHRDEGLMRTACGRLWRRKWWRGPYFRLLRRHDNNLNEFLRDENPFDGLREIFARDSGWCRSIVWLVAFSLVGAFFISIQIPNIQAYQRRDVKTTQSIISAFEITQPGVTVCPPGLGIRCDCQLWKRLACTYDLNGDTNFRFLTCAFPIWASENIGMSLREACAKWSNETTNWNEDPCRGADVPLQGEEVYSRVQSRANETGYPFMTSEEVTVYGAARYNSSLLSFSTRESYYSPLREINDRYIDYKFFETSSGRICTQLRLPLSEKQATRGLETGVQMFLYDTLSSYIATVVDAVDLQIHADYNPPSERVDTVPEDFISISTGVITQIGFEINWYKRLHGYGDAMSQTCASEGDPREVCVYKQSLLSLGKECDVCLPTEFGPYFGLGDDPSYDAYGCDFQCFVSYSPRGPDDDVDLETCPDLCDKNNTVISSHVQARQSDLYRDVVLGNGTNVNDVVDLRIGYSSFSISVVTEGPAQTLASLIGEIGGNVNLWFGPNFMSAFALCEMLTIALLIARFRRVTHSEPEVSDSS